jgi:hypothetical protein
MFAPISTISGGAAASDVSAAFKFFAINELWEQIFMHLPLRDLLCAQLISKKCHTIISKDPRMQKVLFLKPATDDRIGFYTETSLDQGQGFLDCVEDYHIKKADEFRARLEKHGDWNVWTPEGDMFGEEWVEFENESVLKHCPMVNPFLVS